MLLRLEIGSFKVDVFPSKYSASEVAGFVHCKLHGSVLEILNRAPTTVPCRNLVRLQFASVNCTK